MAKISDFERNEANEVVATVGKQKIVLSAEYIEQNKPQIGDEYVTGEAEPAPAEPAAEAPVTE